MREQAKCCLFGYIDGFYNTTRMQSSLNWQLPREFQRAFQAQRLQATTAASTASENITIFSREPSLPGEDITDSMSADARNQLHSMSAEVSAKQASESANSDSLNHSTKCRQDH